MARERGECQQTRVISFEHVIGGAPLTRGLPRQHRGGQRRREAVRGAQGRYAGHHSAPKLHGGHAVGRVPVSHQGVGAGKSAGGGGLLGHHDE